MPPKRKGSATKAAKSASPAKKAKSEAKPPAAKASAVKPADGKVSLASLLEEPGWHSALKSEMEKDYFKSLEEKLNQDYSQGSPIFPPKNLIFNGFNLTPLKKVKVVIIGQDPYHDDGQAHGVCFSVPHGIKVPPSLVNIYKELEEDVKGFSKPSHGCLESWAKEGVLLLNATLTVEAHKPNSHKDYGWQRFTDEVIRTVSSQCDKVVFLLWGNFAHKKEKLVDGGKHVVIKNAHPSPLSFNKFFHCKCFSKANQALQKAGVNPINWQL